VGADREQELDEDLVGANAFGVVEAAELRPHLAELAGPEGQQQRAGAIARGRLVRALGAVVAGASEPAPRELVFHRGVEAEGPRRCSRQ
jgi:hypothetical protein